MDPYDNNDLVVSNGDFYIGFSQQQHIAHILEADGGQYKSSPKLGVGIRRYLNGIIDGEVKRLIQLQLESDGHEIRSLTYTEGQLKIQI